VTSFENVEENVPHIPVSLSKKSVGKKTFTNVSSVPTDNISFHYPKYAQRWKFVCNRRLGLERELGLDALEVEEIVNLIKLAGLEKTVTNLGNCYEKLVKEFLVNIPEDCDDPMRKDYEIVFVSGKKVKFSPTMINRFLGIHEGEWAKVHENEVCKVITANQVKVWPKKYKISSAKFSVKYAILNMIGAANWAPTTHSSDVATGMAKFIYCIGTKTKMNFGAHIFEKTMRHGKSDATRLPIVFPTLLSEIIVDQQSRILIAADVPKKKESPLSLHYKLFGSHHVADIVATSGAGAAATTDLMTRKEMLGALKDTCKYLEERKTLFEIMILALDNEEANAGVDDVNAGVEGEDAVRKRWLRIMRRMLVMQKT
jgi:hypothetical protein